MAMMTMSSSTVMPPTMMPPTVMVVVVMIMMGRGREGVESLVVMPMMPVVVAVVCEIVIVMGIVPMRIVWNWGWVEPLIIRVWSVYSYSYMYSCPYSLAAHIFLPSIYYLLYYIYAISYIVVFKIIDLLLSHPSYS